MSKRRTWPEHSLVALPARVGPVLDLGFVVGGFDLVYFVVDLLNILLQNHLLGLAHAHSVGLQLLLPFAQGHSLSA